MKRKVALFLCGLLLLPLLPLPVKALDYDPRRIGTKYTQVDRPQSDDWPWHEGQRIEEPKDTALRSPSSLTRSFLMLVGWLTHTNLIRNSHNMRELHGGHSGSTEQSSNPVSIK